VGDDLAEDVENGSYELVPLAVPVADRNGQLGVAGLFQEGAVAGLVLRGQRGALAQAERRPHGMARLALL
jgi:hypothetical protein